MRRWAGILIACLAMTTSVWAADTRDLIAERARAEHGATMPDHGYFQVRLAEGAPVEGDYIREFWTDKATGQFIANLVTDMGQVKRVWGVAVLTVDIPVPTRRILPQEIIAPADLQLVAMPWGRVNSFAVTDPKALTGMEVRRMLSPGRPVQRQSITQPVIVSRGEQVTIELTYGALYLTAPGKAISDAHLGQEVRVVNLSSNKTITGIARADGLVEAKF